MNTTWRDLKVKDSIVCPLSGLDEPITAVDFKKRDGGEVLVGTIGHIHLRLGNDTVELSS